METQIKQTTELVLTCKGKKSIARKVVSTTGTEEITFEFQNIKISKNSIGGEIISGTAVLNGEHYNFEIDKNAPPSKNAENLKQLNLLFSSAEATELETLLLAVQNHKSLSTPEVLAGQNFTLSREASFFADSFPQKSVMRFISSSSEPETIYTIGENFVSNLHTEQGVDYFVTYNGKEYDLPADKIAKAKFGSRDYKTKEIYLKATRLQRSLEFLKKILNCEATMEEILANRTSKPSGSQPND